MGYRGDYNPGAVLYFNFTSLDTSVSPPVPYTLAGGTVSIYKNDSLTQTTTGVTLSVDHDGITGLNNVKIDTGADGTYFAASNHFQAILTAGTVNGVPVAGYVLESFSLQAGMAATLATLATNMTTVLARFGSITGTGVNTLLGFFKALLSKTASAPSDIGGTFNPATDSTEALADNVSGGSLTEADIRHALGMGTANMDIQLVSLQADTDDIQLRLPAALVSGRMDSSVGAMAANTLTASALATDAVTEIQTGLSTLTAAGIRAAIGMSIANMDIQLVALAAQILTVQNATTNFADVTSVSAAKANLAQGVRALVDRFFDEHAQSAGEQIIRNDAGTVIATLPVSNVGGTITYSQAT